MKYVDKSVKYFIDKLAAKTPAPGGGSSAALAGALGCGLLSMVANFTLAKKGYNGYKERAKKSLKASENLRRKLIDLVDKDIQAYERFSKAYKRSKTKPLNLEPFLKRAAMPPLEMCQHISKAASVSLELAYVGNKSIISDVYVAIYLLDAAFESAMANVKLNLKYIKDNSYVNKKINICSEQQKDVKRLKTEVVNKIKQALFT